MYRFFFDRFIGSTHQSLSYAKSLKIRFHRTFISTGLL